MSRCTVYSDSQEPLSRQNASALQSIRGSIISGKVDHCCVLWSHSSTELRIAPARASAPPTTTPNPPLEQAAAPTRAGNGGAGRLVQLAVAGSYASADIIAPSAIVAAALSAPAVSPRVDTKSE